jgi:mono/diheme cytochrome c family protein
MKRWLTILFAAVVTVGLSTADTQEGPQVFQENCAMCHGNEGQGGVGPALAGNEQLEDTEAAINQVLQGGGGMPAFADQLSDEQVAAVLTHERNSWGNEFGEVTADQVAQARGGQGRQEQSASASAEEPTPEQVWQIARARGPFVENCSICHRVDASGDIGPALAGNGRLGDASLVLGQILHGGGGMPAFGPHLSDEEIAGIAGVIRTSFGNEFGPVSVEEVARQREQLVEGGAWFSLSQAARGYGHFREHCIACHGTQLEGRPPNPPLTGERFAQDWGGKTVRELFDFVRRNMPQGNPGSLTDSVYADAVALILQRNGFPAGERDLNPSAALDQMLIPTTIGGGGGGQEAAEEAEEEPEEEEAEGDREGD